MLRSELLDSRVLAPVGCELGFQLCSLLIASSEVKWVGRRQIRVVEREKRSEVVGSKEVRRGQQKSREEKRREEKRRKEEKKKRKEKNRTEQKRESGFCSSKVHSE